MEFTGFGKNEALKTEKIIALSPEGTINIPEGKYTLSLKVYLEQGRAVEKLYLSFENPKLVLPIDLTGIERRKWLTIEQEFTKTAASNEKDQFKIEIKKEDVPKIKAAKLYIDDIDKYHTID